jgi:hypothetical protein
LGTAIILLVLFHLTWRYLSQMISGSSDAIKVGPAAVSIRTLGELLNALHPWALSDRLLCVLGLATLTAAVVLGLSPLSPFGPQEIPPAVKNFLVHYADGQTKTVAIGGLIEIPADTQALIEAVVPDQVDTSCSWFTMKGRQLPAQGCAMRYNAPFEGNRDVLSVLVRSPCKTWQTFAGLHIGLVHDQSQP